MKRYCEPVDGMVAIGMLATLVGSYFLFMASNGVLQGASQAAAIATASGPMAAMEWIEPALGEAVVENELLERAAASDLAAAVKQLNVATLAAQSIDATPERLADVVGTLAGMTDTEHAARVQYVLGRSIVNSTSRGVRAGLVSGETYDTAFNRRIIETTEATGDRLRAGYAQVREPLLGQLIVGFSRDAGHAGSQIQQRIGAAIARVTSIQEGYPDIKGEAQTQLGLLMVAAVNAGLMSEPVEKPGMGSGLSPQSVFFAEERSWPEVPVSALILASMGLIGLFCAGIFLHGAEPEAPVLEKVKPEYRKTA